MPGPTKDTNPPRSSISRKTPRRERTQTEQPYRCECGAGWSGLAMCHCSLCHETFSGVTTFDRHIRGSSNTYHVHPPEVLKKNGEPALVLRTTGATPTWVDPKERDLATIRGSK